MIRQTAEVADVPSDEIAAKGYQIALLQRFLLWVNLGYNAAIMTEGVDNETVAGIFSVGHYADCRRHN